MVPLMHTWCTCVGHCCGALTNGPQFCRNTLAIPPPRNRGSCWWSWEYNCRCGRSVKALPLMHQVCTDALERPVWMPSYCTVGAEESVENWIGRENCRLLHAAYLQHKNIYRCWWVVGGGGGWRITLRHRQQCCLPYHTFDGQHCA